MPRFVLDLPPGIISDDTDFSTEGRYVDGNNVRFHRGRAQNIGGWEDTDINAVNKCRDILPFTDETNGQVTAIVDLANVKVSVALSTSLWTITPVGYGVGLDNTTNALDIDTRTRTVALDLYGQNLIINPSGGGIYRWTNNTASAATVVTNAPAKVNYTLVTPERQILALGCNEVGGTYNPLCIRGCDIENITSWTPTSSNNSFEHILEDKGMIITARRFGRFVAVWTTTSVWLGQFIGEFDQTYRFDRIAENAGAVSPNSVVVVDQPEGPTAYWIGPDLVPRVWTLGGQPIVMSCPIRNATIANITITAGVAAQGPKIWGIWLKKFNEVWWFYPDSRDGTTECSRYIAYCIDETRSAQTPVWFMGIMARTGGTSSAILADPYMVDSSNNIHRHETGATKTGAANWHITTGDFSVDDGGRAVMLKGIEPDYDEQAGSVSLSVFTKQYPQSSQVTSGPHTVANDATKVDFRATGRIFAIKQAGTTATDFMRVGRHVFPFEILGQR